MGERQYQRNDTGLALDALRCRRQETLALLARLAPEQWERGSVHVTLGRMTFADWVALIAAHDDKHLASPRAGRASLIPRLTRWGPALERVIRRSAAR